MDYENYDYVPAKDYTNVFASVHKTRAQNPNGYFVTDRIKPFIDALVAARPQWKFVCDRVGYAPTTHPTSMGTFSVYAGSEKVGEVTTDSMYRDGEDHVAYAYDTVRLSRARQRGAWSKSTKLDVAVKAVLKNFYTKTIDEVLEHQITQLREHVATHTQRKRRAFLSEYDKVSDAVRDIAIQNWGYFSEQLTANGVAYSPDMETLYEAHKIATRLNNASAEWKGVAIHLRGDDYIVVRNWNTGDKTVSIHSSEGLPDHTRRSLGLLKLLEDGNAIADVGFRLNANTYFVMDKESS